MSRSTCRHMAASARATSFFECSRRETRTRWSVVGSGETSYYHLPPNGLALRGRERIASLLCAVDRDDADRDEVPVGEQVRFQLLEHGIRHLAGGHGDDAGVAARRLLAHRELQTALEQRVEPILVHVRR